MPFSVPLRFVPPDAPDLVSLKIWEGTSAAGSFNVIETVTSIGSYPTYIDHHTTQLAASKTNWFAISWVDAAGAETEISAPVQGGTTTLIGEVIERAMLRDPTANEQVVKHEAEAVIQSYFGDATDPYDPTLTASYRVMNGLANLALARSYISTAITSTSANKWAAGLVSMDTSTGSGTTVSQKSIEDLIKLANQDLNRSYSVILLTEDIAVAGGFKQNGVSTGRVAGVDLTRGILMVGVD